MPYQCIWIDPEIALNNYKGVTVYHGYNGDEIDEKLYYWFTTDILAKSTEDELFDIRKLSTYRDRIIWNDKKSIEGVLCAAVDTGEIVACKKTAVRSPDQTPPNNFTHAETFAALCAWEWVRDEEAYTGKGLIEDREKAIVLGAAIEREWDKRGYNDTDERPREGECFDLILIPEIMSILWNGWASVEQAFNEVMGKSA